MLSKLVSAFRLERKSFTRTTKRVHADEPEASEEKVEQEVSRIVGCVFTPEYLQVRGLSDAEIAEHQRLLAGALGQLLRRWDAFACSIRNTSSILNAPPLPDVAMVLGVVPDVMARAAAYDHAYGHLHPVRQQLPMVIRKTGLKDWWASFVRRLGWEPSWNKLDDDTCLAKKTIRAGLTGGLPTGGVMVELAKRLAALEPRAETGNRPLTAAEIEFEIRATAAAQAALSLAHKVEPSERQRWVEQFKVYRSVVAGLERAEALDLLEHGIESPAFAQLQEATAASAMGSVLVRGAQMAARMAMLERLFHEDPQAAIRLFVADNRAMAEALRVHGKIDGLDVMAEFHEHTADLFEAVFAGKTPRQMRPGYLEELKAFSLVTQAIAPWLRRTPTQAEALLLQAVECCPSSRLARHTLARHLVAQSRREEAIEQYRECTRLQPEDTSAWHSLVWHLGELDRWQEALDALDGCSVESLDLRALRGYCLTKLGQLDEARSLLKAVHNADKTNVVALDGLALLAEAQGNKKEASTLLRKAWFHVGPPLKVGNGP
ncbi:MAG: hypothetical protein IPM35_41265 [Myxococcales bacterium]|nr:hypothetical protein [Myxococcales bacterium]